MANETGPRSRKGSVRLQSEHQLSSSRSEYQGMWEGQNCTCRLLIIGKRQCFFNNARHHQMKQSSSQKLKHCSISSEDCTDSRSRKSKFGSHKCGERTPTYQQHWSSAHFSRLALSLVLLLSVFSTPSLAHDLPWDSWSIEDPSAPGNVYSDSAALDIPDLVAIAGRLFQYQVSTGTPDRSSLHFQAREAGRNKLPKWISFDSTSGTFSGVPLNEDKGKLYITLDVYISKGGGSVAISETLFSLKVVAQKPFTSPTPPKSQTILPNRTNCLENFYLSQEKVPSFPICPGGSPPILATLLTYPSMTKLSGAARVSSLVSLSKALDVCPHTLVVDNICWSSVERMKLWSQLAQAGITKYLDSTSTISLTLSCDINYYKSQSVIDMVLQNLNKYVSEQPQTEFDVVLWFVSSSANVLEKSVGSTTVHTRLRRQVVDLEELPTIEITTTSPELVSSSAATSLPSSQQQAAQTSSTSTVDGGISALSISTSSTTMTNMFTGGSTLTTRSPATFASFVTADVPRLTSVAPTTTSVSFSTTDLPTHTPSSSADVLESTLPMLPPSSRALENPTITSGLDLQTSVVSGAAQPTSILIAPSSRVVPSSEPTLILTPPSLPPAIQPSLPSLEPSPSERLTSSERGPEIAISSIPVVSLMFSMESRLLTSLPILTESFSPTADPSRLFTIQSSIDDLQSPTPTVSILPSSLLPASSSEVILTPDTSTPLPSPSPSPSLRPSTPFSTQLLTETSLTPIISSSDILLPETPMFSTPLITDSSLAPAISSDILLPDTASLSTLLLTESSFAPTISSGIATTTLFQTSTEPSLPPELSSTVFMLVPTSTMPDFTSDLLMPETSLLPSATSGRPFSSTLVVLPTIEPTLTLTAELPISSSSEVPLTTIQPTPSFSSELLTTAIPDSTVFSSPVVPSSSNNLLMPMSSSELTLSLSIFTPSPVPSLSFSSMDIFPDPSSTHISAPTTTIQPDMTSSMVDAFTSSSILVLLPETTSVVFVSPTITSVIASSDFITTSMPLPSSSEEIIFPEPTTILIPLSSSLATSSIVSQTPFVSSATSSIDVFMPSSSVVLPTETEVISPESTTFEPPLTTLDFTASQTFSSSVAVELTETMVLQTTQLSTATVFQTATPSPPSTFSPSFSRSPSFTPSPSSFLTPSPSPSLTPSPSSSQAPSPSFSPSPSPPLSFCERFNIDCGKGICLDDDDIDIISLAFCQCFPDYTGTFCNDIIDDCSPSQCSLDGTGLCIDGNSTFTCICREEYTGELCDELLFPCLSTPCHSLATCVDLGVGDFECVCPMGYTGVLCDEDIDPCDPNPCTTNETCVVVDAQNFMCSERSVSMSVIIPTSTTVPPSVSDFISPSQTVSSSLVTVASSSIVRSSDTSRTISSTLVQSTVVVSPSPTLTPSPPVSNKSPMLINPIGTLIANRGQIFRFAIPEDTFYDLESGSASSLSLTLLNYRSDPLPNTTWVQINEGNIEGLPLSLEITNEAITDHLFILQAQDDVGNSAHDFVTIRVFPLGPFSSLFTVLFENDFEMLNQNITHKINLVERLSSLAISSRVVEKRQLELSPQNYNPEEIFIREIFDTSPLSVSYKNLTIPDLDCTEFYKWIQNIYNFTSNEYTLRFLQAMAPDFHPTPTPTIEGICRLTTSNIPPIVGEEIEIDISDTDISHRTILLGTLVPAACVALCCLLLGLCALCMYRRRRSERKYCTSRRLYLNRRPIVLEGEADFPDRRGRPVILENELALQGDSDEEEELSNVSSDLSIIPPAEGERERLVRLPSVSPPNYRLPPLYTHEQFYDYSHDR